MTTFVLCDVLPGGGGAYAHYEGRLDDRAASEARWKFRDVRQAVLEHGDPWFEQLDQWHRELCRRGAALTDGWWLLPASRLSAWYPIDLKPLAFALGVIKCAELAADAVLHVVGASNESAALLREWSAPGHFHLDDQRRHYETAVPANRPARPWRAAARELGAIAMRRLLDPRPAPAGAAGLVVWSHALAPGIISEIGDHFFGRALDHPDIRALNVQWVYGIGSFRDRAGIRHEGTRENRRLSFDFEFLRLRDLPGILVESIRARQRLRVLFGQLPPLAIGGQVSSLFPRTVAARAGDGYLPIYELAVHRAIRRCLVQTQARAIVYPYEEKGLERAILRACREQQPPVKTIGFAHAAHSHGHWYLRDQRQDGRPAPDVIATTGPAATEWLTTWGRVPAAHLQSVGSPRSVQALALSTARPAKLRVLFLVGLAFELEQFAGLAAHPGVLDRCELRIRRYPHGWHAAQERGIARLRALGIPFSIDAAALTEQVAWADVVLFSSTSAGIEAMLMGRPVVRVNLDEFVDADPTRGKAAADHVWRVTSADELATALAAFSAGAGVDVVERQRVFAEGLYAPFDRRAFIEAAALC